MNYLYYFLNKDDEIIYIGKTKDLKRRMKEHFLKGHLDQECYRNVYKIMATEVNDSKYDTEICETLLINKYKPIYNTDKKYNENNNKTSFNLIDLHFEELYLDFYDDILFIHKEKKMPDCYSTTLTKKKQCETFLDYNLGVLKHKLGLLKKYSNNLYEDCNDWLIDELISVIQLIKENIDVEYSDIDEPLQFYDNSITGGHIAFNVNILEKSHLSLTQILILVNSGIFFRITNDIYAMPLFVAENLIKINQLYINNDYIY